LGVWRLSESLVDRILRLLDSVAAPIVIEANLDIFVANRIHMNMCIYTMGGGNYTVLKRYNILSSAAENNPGDTVSRSRNNVVTDAGC
jgi:hypothetical protein